MLKLKRQIMLKLFLVYFISFASSSWLELARPSNNNNLNLISKFQSHIESGDIHSLELLISANPKFFKSSGIVQLSARNRAFQRACAQNNMQMIKLLLMKGNVDASIDNDIAIGMAAEQGDLELVRTLLARPEVNPGATKNLALIKAIKNGHTDIVRLLIAHQKVDLAIRDVADRSMHSNYALSTASFYNRPDIVRLLIEDGNLNPGPLILFRGAENGDADLVRYLLRQPSLHQNRLLSSLFQYAGYLGNEQMIRTYIEGGMVVDQNTINGASEFALHNAKNENLSKYLLSLKVSVNLPSKPLIQFTGECAICLGEKMGNAYITGCKHEFHPECLQSWITRRNSCPVCRASVL